MLFLGVRTLDKKSVAIKLLTNEHPTPDEIIRFKQEFEIAKIFETEKDIVHVYAFEKSETTYAIIMEMIPGASLANILKK
jgi:serine/threonine protein kinase